VSISKQNYVKIKFDMNMKQFNLSSNSMKFNVTSNDNSIVYSYTVDYVWLSNSTIGF